jgi:glycine cleavage system aminomethyltransferase T
MSDFASRAAQPTPLHARTADLCATNQWIEEAGFTVPAVYSSLGEEQEVLTSRVGMSDLSQRQCWTVEGPDAAAYLSWVSVADVTRLEAGQTARTLWCDDRGYVRGEGVVARFGKASFEVRTPVRDFPWLADGAKGFDVKVANATGSRAVIGVRGPLTASLLGLAGLTGEAPAGASQGARPTWRPAEVSLMRDASGEGLELWAHTDDAIVVWEKLWRAGAGLGVAAVGAVALEAARIESGVPRAGVDWLPAQLAASSADLRVPVELGVAVDFAHRFNGAAALQRRQAAGGRVLVQFTAETPLQPGSLMLRNATAGRITSCSWSQSRGAAFALGWLDAEAVKAGAKATAAGGVVVEILRAVFG